MLCALGLSLLLLQALHLLEKMALDHLHLSWISSFVLALDRLIVLIEKSIDLGRRLAELVYLALGKRLLWLAKRHLISKLELLHLAQLCKLRNVVFVKKSVAS
jgi:hypothetical protein